MHLLKYFLFFILMIIIASFLQLIFVSINNKSKIYLYTKTYSLDLFSLNLRILISILGYLFVRLLKYVLTFKLLLYFYNIYKINYLFLLPLKTKLFLKLNYHFRRFFQN